MTKQFKAFNNDDLLEEYYYFRILYDGLDITLDSNYYIDYVEKELNNLKKECLRRMGDHNHEPNL